MTENTRLLRPSAGQNSVIPVGPDARLEFTFDVADAHLNKEGQDLVLKFDDGGVLTLQGFYDNFDDSAQPPTLIVEGGELPGEAFLAALNNPELMPAAGPAAGPVLGGGSYTDAVLAGIDGVDGLAQPALDVDADDAANVDGTEAPQFFQSVALEGAAGTALAAATAGGGTVITGGAGDDTLTGGAGNDTMYGGAGNDIMYGGAGDDIMYGGAGDNFLYGGTGVSFLNGGTGDGLFRAGRGVSFLNGDSGDDDIFAYTRADMDGKTDTIFDFRIGEDHLRFDDLFAEEDALNELLNMDNVLYTQSAAGTSIFAESGDIRISLNLGSADHSAAMNIKADAEYSKTVVFDHADFTAQNEEDAVKLLHDIISVGG